MPIDLSWDVAQQDPVIVLTAVTVLYTVFHYRFHATVWETRLRSSGYGRDPQARGVLLQRFSGAVLLGIVPLGLVLALGGNLFDHGLGLGRFHVTLAWAVGVYAILVWVLRRSAHNREMWPHYPQVRSLALGADFWRLNAVSWVVYLTGYEFFFRGFLLFEMTDWVGPWPAIAITTGLYVFAHLPKVADETYGSILMGVVFAVMTLHSNTIWGAVILHSAIAISSDTFVRNARSAAPGTEPRQTDQTQRT